MTKKNDRNLVDVNTGILDTENEIYSQNDKGINITASGSTIRVVNVTAYNAYTNLGDGTLQIGGGAITYTNGTGVYLVAGDVVAVATDTSGNNVAVAIISRSGSSTAGSGVPIVYPSADFPINSNSLVFPIQYLYPSGGPSFASDMSGGLGLGADTIIGYNGNVTSINAFNRSTATSSSLYANPGTSTNIYVTSYGRVIQTSYSSPSAVTVTIRYRDAGSLSWSSETFSGPSWGGSDYAMSTSYDYTTETFWAAASNGTGGMKYLKLGPTDSSFVDCGNLGITAASSSPYYAMIIANNGSLVLFTGTLGSTTSDIYMKFSGDNSNFTKYGTFAQASFPLGNSGSASKSLGYYKKYDVTTLGAVTQVIAVSGQLYYYRLNLNGSVDALPTGIPTATTGFRYENHLNLHSREYPLLQIICREVDIMPGGSTSYVAVIATFDPTTVSVPPYTATPYYLFYDATNQLRANSYAGTCAPLQEVSTNKVRTLWDNTGATYPKALNEITVL